MYPTYVPDPDRYDGRMPYRRCGRSGLLLPALSLGFWQNFGDDKPLGVQREIVRRAFDAGITHFDLANNYGPPYGQAEVNFGTILRQDLTPFRDELVISTKAGYEMWPGPYGQRGGSRKYLLASLDQSLRRMGLDYVDIFYSHCFDPDTPLEETVTALDHAVRSGKALYVGISSYSDDETRQAARIARELGTPLLIHQPLYNMFNRWIEPRLVEACESEGMGIISFTALAQGLLTDRYLDGIPGDSRAARGRVAVPGDLERRGPQPHPGPERDRPGARAVAGADGARLGAAGPAGHVHADRGLVAETARHQPRSPRQPDIHRRRAGRHRPVRRCPRNPALTTVGAHTRRSRLVNSGKDAASRTAAAARRTAMPPQSGPFSRGWEAPYQWNGEILAQSARLGFMGRVTLMK